MSKFLTMIDERDYFINEAALAEIHRAFQTESVPKEQVYLDFPIVFKSMGKSSTPTKPYHFGNNRYVMVYSGTIYNTFELKKNLQKDGSLPDTEEEIIAQLFAEYGTKAFTKLNGSFAIIIWDYETDTLYGARDHFGMETLYYLDRDQKVYFSNEKRELLPFISSDELDEVALQHYLTYQYVPEPYTIMKQVKELQAGHYFEKQLNKEIQIKKFFCPKFKPENTDRDVLKKQIREEVFKSVELHLQKESKLGALLSGGIDSTIIAAIAKEIRPNIKTFTVGFERTGFSEIHLAQQTANHLGLENIAYTITPEEFLAELPHIISQMTEPLADPAAVPLYFVLREAKREVAAVLSGEGADELFGGYNIYREPQSLKVFNHLPKPMHSLLHQVAKVFPEGMKGKEFILRGTTELKERYVGNAKIFKEAEKEKFYNKYQENIPYQTVTENLYAETKGQDPIHQMQYVDMKTWLPGDILLKANRMAKANDIKLYSPFLSQDIFHITRTLQTNETVINGGTKMILRETFADMIPEEVTMRKKLGFPVPIRHWLKTDWYDWAYELINKSETDHLFDKRYLLKILSHHALGKGDYSRKLWVIIIFMLWYEIYIEKNEDFSNLFRQRKTVGV